MAPSSPARLAPSGRQFVLGHGRDQVVVTEMGATLRTYQRAGRPVVDGFDEDDLCPSGRGQILAPWPNRLADGRYRFGERRGRAALDEPEHANAIHGLVRWLPWEPRSQAQNVLTMACVLHPQPGYPWRLGLSVEYRLGRDGLSVTTEATNLDHVPAPFGIGFHPYLTVGTPAIDTTRLRLGSGHVLRSDGRGIPEGRAPVQGSEFDFRVERPVGPTRLDTAFTDLERDSDGLAWVEMGHPDEDRSVSLWMDSTFGYVMAYSADTVVAEERRRRSLAVEPMTCPPDAFRSGESLVVLEPGASWRGAWGIRPS
ncbi:MAG TPA: aldose 1-epimerase family protein [Acidimicrobiales bacterium]|nr:aldose 1-epimerase family protein [Acidimicrobiales bacterium]